MGEGWGGGGGGGTRGLPDSIVRNIAYSMTSRAEGLGRRSIEVVLSAANRELA